MSKDTKRIGAVGEMAAVKRFLELGYEVFREVSDNSRIDLIVIKDNVMQRIQVKTATTCPDGFVSVPRWKRVSSQRIYYTKADVDFIVQSVLNKNLLLKVPIEDITGQELSLRFEEPKNGHKSKMVSDYIL